MIDEVVAVVHTKVAAKKWMKKAKVGKFAEPEPVAGVEKDKVLLKKPPKSGVVDDFSDPEPEPEPEVVELEVVEPDPAKRKLEKMKKAKKIRPRKFAAPVRKKATQRSTDALDVGRVAVKSSQSMNFLQHHCMLDPSTRKFYQDVYTQADESGSGGLDYHELVRGLKTINKKLISDKEVEYVVRILDMMQLAGAQTNGSGGTPAVSFEQFACIAALSEKVVGLKEDERDQIASMDFEAVQKKMTTSKDLFFLECNEWGDVDLNQMEIILKSGRIAESHEKDVISRLRSDGQNELTFLDFLAHVPLFVDIHNDIAENPMRSDKRPEINLGSATTVMVGASRWAKKTNQARAANAVREPVVDHWQGLAEETKEVKGSALWHGHVMMKKAGLDMKAAPADDDGGGDGAATRDLAPAEAPASPEAPAVSPEAHAALAEAPAETSAPLEALEALEAVPSPDSAA